MLPCFRRRCLWTDHGTLGNAIAGAGVTTRLAQPRADIPVYHRTIYAIQQRPIVVGLGKANHAPG